MDEPAPSKTFTRAQRLEKARLVVWRADPDDGRVSWISVSQRGMQKMRAVRLARKKRIATLLDDWTDDDRRKFGHLLARSMWNCIAAPSAGAELRSGDGIS